jgi:DNA-binding protein H-NS
MGQAAIALSQLGCRSRYAAIGVEGVVAGAYSSRRYERRPTHEGPSEPNVEGFLSMKIKSMSLSELVKVKVRVDAEIELRAAADRSRLIDALGRLRRMSISGKGNGASHPLAGKKLPPKYRNPKNRAETWAGRGNRPRWLVKALKAGKRFEAFAVK